MNRSKQITRQLKLIAAINYDNPQGGPYAYLQFLAYNRELIRMLRSLKRAERQVEALEAASWLFNEYLAVKFTHSQRVIFDNTLLELKEVFSALGKLLQNIDAEESTYGMVHELAA